jgi:hypothetical protein
MRRCSCRFPPTSLNQRHAPVDRPVTCPGCRSKSSAPAGPVTPAASCSSRSACWRRRRGARGRRAARHAPRRRADADARGAGARALAASARPRPARGGDGDAAVHAAGGRGRGSDAADGRRRQPAPVRRRPRPVPRACAPTCARWALPPRSAAPRPRAAPGCWRAPLRGRIKGGGRTRCRAGAPPRPAAACCRRRGPYAAWFEGIGCISWASCGACRVPACSGAAAARCSTCWMPPTACARAVRMDRRRPKPSAPGSNCSTASSTPTAAGRRPPPAAAADRLAVRAPAGGRAHHAAARARARQSGAPADRVEVALAEPAWRDEHLVRLLKERLAKLVLEAPVIGLGWRRCRCSRWRRPTNRCSPSRAAARKTACACSSCWWRGWARTTCCRRCRGRLPARAGQRLGAGAAKGPRPRTRARRCRRRAQPAAPDLAAGQADRAADARPPALLRLAAAHGLESRAHRGRLVERTRRPATTSSPRALVGPMRLYWVYRERIG